MKDKTIPRRSSKALTLVTAVLLVGGLAGCAAAESAGTAIAEVLRSSAPSVDGKNPAAQPAMNPDDIAAALARLASLPVKGRAPKTGYSRDRFGPAWADTDHNGCDTRNDILARDLAGETFKPGTRDCVVATGTLADKYTGKTIRFVRGADTSSAVQIDHIVPLSLAWQTGAQQIDDGQRQEFANDPLNLMAADGPSNMAKSDKDAATWLPPNKAFRCEYTARITAVKAKYKLWVTQPEHDAIQGILAACA
ncbi:HNH endonuclease family protein [Arthrobacter sp. UNC362MFTsu5.1]|uniref:HNH endonuclease family protein n=1 Tax=Arthrobacter sp. UNC362MFTsu5.1 TaxID=1449044 RepID=UPI0005BE6A0F|nr:HNH endonuclease family protein [Arthrobacter sp. UNC362MFTsu5.1]